MANLFVREGRLIYFKHGAGRTIVFNKHGEGRTVESQPKFQNSPVFLGIFGWCYPQVDQPSNSLFSRKRFFYFCSNGLSHGGLVQLCTEES